jgi:hypothetical protein
LSAINEDGRKKEVREKGNIRTAFNSWISCALQGNAYPAI